jgi:ubiquinone/menaquinone biosynthesis C-methylase UbiE
MLAAARWHAQQRGVTNVEFLHRDFRRPMLGPGLADAVISQYALHHVTDAEKATVLAAIHRVLRPDGLFYLEDDTFNSHQGSWSNVYRRSTHSGSMSSERLGGSISEKS